MRLEIERVPKLAALTAGGGEMTFLCFFKGCTWLEATHELFGSELLLCQCCSRCGSRRYLPEPVSAEAAGEAV